MQRRFMIVWWKLPKFHVAHYPVIFFLCTRQKILTACNSLIYHSSRFIPTTKNQNGTNIKLKLHDDFFDKIESSSLNEIIENNMTRFSIPIVLKDIKKDKTYSFDKNNINVPDDYELINDIEIIDIILNDESYEKLSECSVGHIEKEQYEFFKNLDSFSL